MQTWQVFFKPGLTGLMASKPGYLGLDAGYPAGSR